MRCRRFVTENSKRTMVYFGSYGLDFSTILVELTINLQSLLGKYDDEIFISTTMDYIGNDTWRKEELELTLRDYHEVEFTTRVRITLDKLENGDYRFTIISLNDSTIDIAFDISDWDVTTAYDDYGTFVTPLEANTSCHARILGKAKRPSVDNDNVNYAVRQEGVAMSLMQRLTIIKGELKHFMNIGFPLFDKHPTKAMLDAYVVRTILNHPDVKNLVTFNSSIENRTYTCTTEISTIYGSLTISNSQSI